MNYCIREVKDTDIEKGLLKIFIKGYNLHQSNRPDKFSDRSYERLKEILVETINNKKFLVIDYDNKIIGYASYEIKEKNRNKILWIDELVIDDDFQGKGYGKVVISELEKLSKKENCKSIEFCCWEFNSKAREIYEYLGYKIQRRIYEKEI